MRRLLFDHLDVNLMLEFMLKHVGDPRYSDNVHWLSWDDAEALAMVGAAHDLEGSGLHFLKTPRLKSFIDQPFDKVLGHFKTNLNPQNWTRLCDGESVCINQVSLFPVSNANYRLGVLSFENLRTLDVERLHYSLKQFFEIFVPYLRFGLMHWEAIQLSYKDELTDLYNQRYLPMVLDKEIHRAQRSKQSFSVLFLDLDYFKSINDSKGHWVGSKLLADVGKIIKKAVRTTDYAFRYGGDEYLVVLVESDAKAASVVAERIRSDIESTDFSVDGHDIRLTVSIGLATFPEHAKTSEEVLRLADQAMYYGKRKSRNIVFIAS